MYDTGFINLCNLLYVIVTYFHLKQKLKCADCTLCSSFILKIFSTIILNLIWSKNVKGRIKVGVTSRQVFGQNKIRSAVYSI